MLDPFFWHTNTAARSHTPPIVSHARPPDRTPHPLCQLSTVCYATILKCGGDGSRHDMQALNQLKVNWQGDAQDSGHRPWQAIAAAHLHGCCVCGCAGCRTCFGAGAMHPVVLPQVLLDCCQRHEEAHMSTCTNHDHAVDRSMN